MFLREAAKKMQERNGGKALTGLAGYKIVRDTLNEHDLPIEDLKKFVTNSQKSVDIEDRDSLFVPGEVVLLYETKDSEQESATLVKACVVEGSHMYLRMVEFNEGTIADHYCDSYLMSLNDCLTSFCDSAGDTSH